MANSQDAVAGDGHHDEESRRDFLFIATGAVGAAGVAAAVWPLIDQMNPSADVLAAGTTEIDLTPIEVGQAITVKWRGKPVFIRRRTKKEIAEASGVVLGDLSDPAVDADRVQKPEWLILVGICTHLGCIPQGTRVGEPRGDYGGWFCPCHGSHYDTSGRIRKGPAPKNLEVPPYSFIENNKIRIG